jgi:outer membrane receptor protein involved in Fe transport
VAYWDLMVSFRWKEFDAVVGCDNVLDRDPPFMPEGSQNANTSTYDALGRYFWVKLGYKF